MKARNNAMAEAVQGLHLALRRRPVSRAGLAGLPAAARAELARALRWNRSGNIVGFGIGPKTTHGQPAAPAQSLIVFVATKIKKTRLDTDEVVPARVYLRALGRSITTDVVEVGEIPRLQAPMLRPGANAAHFTMLHGSLTAVVRAKGAAGPPLVLSCAHGFAPLGAGGRQIECPPDPRPFTADNEVAALHTAIPLRPGGTVANTIDAALATPIPAKIAGLTNHMPGVGIISSVSPLVSGQFLSNGIRDVIGVGAATPQMTGRIVAERVSTVLADRLGRIFLFQTLVA